MTRLRPAVEAALFIRRAESLAGSAMVLQRGDGDFGAILLLVNERGRPVALLERLLAADGAYRWQRTAADSAEPPDGLTQYVERRRRNDPDLWVIELDIAPAERFIAETMAEG